MIALLLVLPFPAVAYISPIPQTALSLQRGTAPAFDTRSAPPGSFAPSRFGLRRRGDVSVQSGFFGGLFGGAVKEAPQLAAPARILAPGWTEAVDEASGATYWYNAETEESSWDKPLADAPGATLGLGAEEARIAFPMPELYAGWYSREWKYIGSDGETERVVTGTGQIEAQYKSAVAAAEAAGIRRMEVTFPPVPNLEEVDFGTALNLQFSFEIRQDLGLTSDMLKSMVRRNLVDFSNQHWAVKLAQSMGVGRKVAIQHCDQTSKKDCIPLDNISVSRSGKESPPLGKDDVLVIVNPGTPEQWLSAAKPVLPGNTLVYLNSISGGWTYELGGPDKEAEQVYFLKRISKGWVFRQYPGPWQALVERPDGSVQVLATYDQRPLLREVSGLVRKYSFDKFAINNDRYAKGFGARL